MSTATPRASCIALLAALVGCGAGTSPAQPDASGADTPSPDATEDAGHDVAADGPPDAEIVCSGGSASRFPTFDRSCRGDGDCFVARHQTDCCGNSRALGLAVSQREAFNAAERTCAAMYPDCGCPASPPVADDGMTAVPPATIVAACRSGQCASFVQ